MVSTPNNVVRHKNVIAQSTDQDFFAGASVMLPETARTGLQFPGSTYTDDDDAINESFNLISKQIRTGDNAKHNDSLFATNQKFQNRHFSNHKISKSRELLTAINSSINSREEATRYSYSRGISNIAPSIEELKHYNSIHQKIKKHRLKPAIHLEDSIMDRNNETGRNTSAVQQVSELYEDGATELSSLTRRKMTNVHETRSFFQNQMRLDNSIDLTSERQTTAINNFR